MKTNANTYYVLMIYSILCAGVFLLINKVTLESTFYHLSNLSLVITLLFFVKYYGGKYKTVEA